MAAGDVELTNISCKVGDDDAAAGPAAPTPARETWGSRADFLFALVGLCVGVGNIWRFPFLCYRHGGSPFLVPYMLALLSMGVPLFCLELAIGQLFRRGVFHSLCALHPRLGGVALAQVSRCF